MNSKLKKWSAGLTLGLVLFLLMIPAGLAQDGLFNTLEEVKTNLATAPECERIEDAEAKEKCLAEHRISLVDFSVGRKWGNLPSETQKALSVYDGLDPIIASWKEAEAKNMSLEDFVKEFEGMTGPDGELNLNGRYLMNEIRYQGESELQAVALAVAKVFRNLMGTMAVVFIVISGVMLVFAGGDEGKITEQKRAIAYAMIGLIVILLIERIIAAVYGVPGEERALTTATASQVSLEIYGFINYVKTVIGATAVGMVILSGIKIVTAQGEEDKIAKEKKAVVWVLLGLVLILINRAVVESLYIKPAQSETGQITQANVQGVLTVFGRVVQFLLGLVGIVAFAALVYGFASMVANFGNDEMVGKAKKIVTNAVIGIVILLSAFAIVSTVIL